MSGPGDDGSVIEEPNTGQLGKATADVSPGQPSPPNMVPTLSGYYESKKLVLPKLPASGGLSAYDEWRFRVQVGMMNASKNSEFEHVLTAVNQAHDETTLSGATIKTVHGKQFNQDLYAQLIQSCENRGKEGERLVREARVRTDLGNGIQLFKMFECEHNWGDRMNKLEAPGKIMKL